MVTTGEVVGGGEEISSESVKKPLVQVWIAKERLGKTITALIGITASEKESLVLFVDILFHDERSSMYSCKLKSKLVAGTGDSSVLLTC